MCFLNNVYLCISALLYLDYLPWQTYQHVSTVIQSLVEEDINVKFLVQLDKLIRLLETPVFAYLRLQVIDYNNIFLFIFFSLIPAFNLPHTRY